MIRVVLDTNIIVSAALNKNGNEASVLRLVTDARVILFVSDEILAEYQAVLSRPKFRLGTESSPTIVKSHPCGRNCRAPHSNNTEFT